MSHPEEIKSEHQRIQESIKAAEIDHANRNLSTISVAQEIDLARPESLDSFDLNDSALAEFEAKIRGIQNGTGNINHILKHAESNNKKKEENKNNVEVEEEKKNVQVESSNHKKEEPHLIVPSPDLMPEATSSAIIQKLTKSDTDNFDSKIFTACANCRQKCHITLKFVRKNPKNIID